jgi:hypothetical protein
MKVSKNEAMSCCCRRFNRLYGYNPKDNSIQMEERPDHPHQAAVHLIKALKCCKECTDVSEADLL